ncbi:TonB-dependent receptor [Colwellia sp. D2M02]|uniref:TonB-dependent receptor n=1 Tax=Colwellia sp. D2M02 TaxID=2841562 RepID=UPI001C08FE55|nr:TonB-dependent receptor [Colwellia sp. D2M02]MBU2892153.1 TonB-dependent receptor [Colwellia sp. D2M02]
MKKKYLSFVIASFLSAQTLAAEAQRLAETKVTDDAISTNTEVSAKDLENIQANDIKSALKKVAGVSVANGVRYSQKVYVRGVEEHSANVTIDGARQDGQLFHHSGNQMVDTNMLKRVEVLLGASSVLSGYGANVGAIKYETKDPADLLLPEQKFGFTAGASADTATEFRQLNLALYGRATEKLSLLAMANMNESGDIETPDNDPIVSKHSELTSGLIKVVYDFDETQQFDFSAQRYDDGGNRNFSGEKPGAKTLEEHLGYNGYIRDTYTLNYYNVSENPLLDLNINVYYNDKQMEREGATGDNWYRDSQGKWHKDGTSTTPKRMYHYKTSGLNIRNTSIISDIAWTYGIESFKSEQSISAKGLAHYTLSDGSQFSEHISFEDGPTATLMSGYVQAELNFGSVQLIPGLRYDDYSLGGTYDTSFSEASPKFIANWQANDDLKLGLSYGRIFKGPGLPETLMIQEGMEESPDVEPETGNHYEFNVLYDLQSLTNIDSFNIFANVYQYNIDHFYHPTKNTSLNKTHDLEMQGMEAGVSLSYQGLNASIKYSYNTGDKDYQSYVTDALTAGTQRVNLSFDYALGDSLVIGWDTFLADNAELTDTYFNRQGDLVHDNVLKAGYGVSNAWLNYSPVEVAGLSVQFGVDNIFDKAYQDHNSFGMYWGNEKYNDNEVGRNFKLTLNYQY